MPGIYILVEHREGELENISFELATLASKIASGLKEELSAIMFGHNDIPSGEKLKQYGVDKLYIVKDIDLHDYSDDAYADALSNLITAKPRMLFCGSTIMGMDMAQRLAAKMDARLISNCISMTVNNNILSSTNYIWQGKLDNTILINEFEPIVVTLVPETIEAKPVKPDRKMDTIFIEPEFDKDKSPRVMAYEIPDPKDIELTEADIIVAAGKGVGQENLWLIEELAKYLGGTVAASRGAVDEGWFPSTKQVGQTGKTVSPRLYLACGISGQIYHTIGIRGSKYIVAINIDRNAPICKIADIGLIGDFKELAKVIVDRLKQNQDE
jgi:electron transfer flavoprotein alpha subunit